MLIERLEALRRLALESEDEAWHMSRRPLARGTTAFVSETLRDADDLGEAMRRIAHGFNIVHGGRFNSVDQRSNRCTYRIDDENFPFDPELAAEERLTMTETVLIFVHAMLSLVAGDDLGRHLQSVRVRRAEKPANDGPLDFWAAPVRLGTAAYQLDYAPSVAAMPVRADFSGFGPAEAWSQAIRMIEARDRSTSGGMADRVRAAIAEGAEDQVQVARRLGVSVATLRRRLEGCGHGFRELRAEVLNDQARSLLGHSHQTADVAEALGFADGRSFARAFKGWNGVTPSCYRARLQARL